MMLCLFTFIGILIGILLFILLIHWKRTLANFPPIPFAPCMPLLGTAVYLKRDPHELYKQASSFAVRYNYLFVGWLSFIPIVQTGRVEYAEFILNSKEHITKSSFYEFLHEWIGTGLLTSNGNKWKQRRRAITPSFHFSILNKFQNIILKHTNVLLSKLQTISKNNESFDIQIPISLVTLDIICETAMGVNMNIQRNSHSDYVNAINEINSEIHTRQKSPWLWSDFIYKYTFSGRNFFRNLKILHDFTTDVINDRLKSKRRENEEDGCRAFLDMLLDLYIKDEIDMDGVREEVDTFMFEGHDTTAAGLSWTLYCLGNNPDVQRKLLSEIDQVSKEEGDLIEKIKNLKYLEYVIKEGLRLHPAIPFIGRNLDKDTVIDNLKYPAGTQIVIGTISLHTNPEYWDRPLEFYPERFGKEGFLKRNPYCYIPFSAGPRNCIGQKFAMLEEKILLYHIMLKFEIYATQKEEDVRSCFEIVHKSDNGLHVKLSRRIRKGPLYKNIK